MSDLPSKCGVVFAYKDAKTLDDFSLPQYSPELTIDDPLRPVEVTAEAPFTFDAPWIPNIRRLSAEDICETQPMSLGPEAYVAWQVRQFRRFRPDSADVIKTMKRCAAEYEAAGMSDHARFMRLEVQKLNNEAGR